MTGDPTNHGPPSPETILSVEDLHAAYGRTRVLRGVSLSVSPGEIVALIGRNGAGKTTTLNSILGKVEITAGCVRLKGEDVTESAAEDTVRRGVALVPEDRRIFPELTVRENLRIGEIGGPDAGFTRDIEAVLDMFENLRVNQYSLGSNLSGGEQQMLAIGRSLVSGADLLMLDEPTEGLAPLIVDRVEELVHELNEEGMSILLVEQNAEVALNVADRVYVLDQGHTVYHGTTQELREDEAVKTQHLGVSM
ncbi:MAG: ABC transporter ATP-binding protein [Halobacteriales archaeon]